MVMRAGRPVGKKRCTRKKGALGLAEEGECMGHNMFTSKQRKSENEGMYA